MVTTVTLAGRCAYVAGLMDRGDHSALDTSLETWRRVLDANLTSVDSGFITAAALPLDGGITEAFTVPE